VDKPSPWVKDRFRCSYPGSQVERSVWTLLVEVADVDAKDVLELTAPEDQQTVEALPAHAADQRSAWAFAFGAWTVECRKLDFMLSRRGRLTLWADR
jgi:hypothetical protein